jgi:hypothetical protein
MATLMSLVGADDGSVDQLGRLNELPGHSAKISDHYRQALLRGLIDQAAHATSTDPAAFTG